MQDILNCEKNRASLEKAAVFLLDELVESNQLISGFVNSETNDGCFFIKPIFIEEVNVIPVRHPTLGNIQSISVDALGISITLLLQNRFKFDRTLSVFSNGFKSLYRSALAHPEKKLILAAIC